MKDMKILELLKVELELSRAINTRLIQTKGDQFITHREFLNAENELINRTIDRIQEFLGS